MYNFLRAFRYFVFGQFIICNAIIASISVLNLSIVQSIDRSSSLAHVDAYLIFLGSAGLFLIFPILFCELCKKESFIGKVWFECLWVGLFWVMELAGAAAITSIGSDEACEPAGIIILNFGSPCASTRVLQAFTWICALFLLCYFILLFVTALVKHKEDRTIWHCIVRRFPWMSAHFILGSGQSSPSDSKNLPRFRTKDPVIVAPRPRKAVSQLIRKAILSYRSGLGLEYDIEYFRASSPPTSPSAERPVPPVPAAVAPQHPIATTREATNTMLSHSLYPQYVQRALPNPIETQVQANRPLPPSPSPIGDWPRMNPTARPLRSKRKTAPAESSNPTQHIAPSTQPLTSHSSRSPSTTRAQSSHRSLPNSVPVIILPPSSAIMPLPTSYIPRSRPTGPRRPSMDDNRPSPLDLSKISAFHSRDYS